MEWRKRLTVRAAAAGALSLAFWTIAHDRRRGAQECHHHDGDQHKKCPHCCCCFDI